MRRWDVFCTVVDNLGDAAICWRLARQLALEHRIDVRLWIDLPETLATLVPGAAVGARTDGVRIERLDAADPRLARPFAGDLPDVVLRTLASTLPDGYRAAMRERRPVWIAYEHLSAEAWVAGHHGLPSPKPDGLVERFFFPGFDAGTGGLPREADLLARRDAFDADPTVRVRFLRALGVVPRRDERLASLFCYPDAPIRALLDAIAAADPRWRVLMPAGLAERAGGHPAACAVPFVAQRDFDALLWSCTLNFVRGEDSFVRALWAGRPMVWQAYRQPDGVHRTKVDAFVRTWCRDGAPDAPAAAAFAGIHDAWNADASQAAPRIASAIPALLAALPALERAARRACAAQAARPDAASRLVELARRGL